MGNLNKLVCSVLVIHFKIRKICVSSWKSHFLFLILHLVTIGSYLHNVDMLLLIGCGKSEDSCVVWYFNRDCYGCQKTPVKPHILQRNIWPIVIRGYDFLINYMHIEVKRMLMTVNWGQWNDYIVISERIWQKSEFDFQNWPKDSSLTSLCILNLAGYECYSLSELYNFPNSSPHFNQFWLVQGFRMLRPWTSIRNFFKIRVSCEPDYWHSYSQSKLQTIFLVFKIESAWLTAAKF